jgi:phage shock protein A
MTLEDFVHTVESRLLGLGRKLLRPDPKSPLYDALDRNQVQIRERQREIAAAEAEQSTLQRRVDDRRAAADLLAAQVETAWAAGQSDRAWRLALDLDRVRQELAEDEKRLPALAQVTWSLGFAVRQLERERARLEKKVQG